MAGPLETAPAPLLAWSYRRTSTTRQAREDRSGMQRQQEALDSWLAAHPQYELRDQLVDPGVSGSTGANRKKGALSRFIAAATAGQVPPGSVLVVESLTRFSREKELRVLTTLLGEFWNRGLGLAVCAHGGVIYSAELLEKEPHQLHLLWGSLSQARAESDERSRRSLGGARKREQLQDQGQPIAAATPWWVCRDRETRRPIRDTTGRFTIDPQAQATIDRAVELAIGGLGTTLIAQQLTAEGYPVPPTAGRRNQYTEEAGAKWSSGRVGYLLRHRALLGDLQRRDGRVIPGFYPPAISVAQWGQLRTAMETRDKLRHQLRGGSQQVHNLFESITRCSKCGGPMSFHHSSERARIGHSGYLACRAGNRRDSEACSNAGYLNYGEAESQLLTMLTAGDWQQWLGQPEQQQELQDLQARTDRSAHEHRALQGRVEHAQQRLQQLWLEEASEIRQAAAEAAVAQLQDQLRAVTAEHQQLSRALVQAQARPSGEAAAAELRGRTMQFWQQLQDGELAPDQRRQFNRWLRTRTPAIQFRIEVAPPAQVELRVGGISVGIHPLAPLARKTARAAGITAPTIAVDRLDERGQPHGVVIRTRTGSADELAAVIEETGGEHQVESCS